MSGVRELDAAVTGRVPGHVRQGRRRDKRSNAMKMYADDDPILEARFAELLRSIPRDQRRRFMRELLTGGAGAYFSLLGLSACDGAGCSGRGDRLQASNTLVCATGTELQPVFSPLFARVQRVIFLMFTQLWRFDREFGLEPQLATRLDIDEDGREYLVQLREGVTWHDGRPLTAHDVVFTVEQLLRPETRFRNVRLLRVGDENVAVQALDDHRVRFVLPEPRASFAADLASVVSIAPQHLLQGQNPHRTPYNDHPIGSGPFKFDEYVAGSHISMVRNESYFEGRPALERIVIRTIPDPEARLAAFQAGDVDLLLWEQEHSKMPQFAAVPGAHLYSLATPYVQQMTLNHADPLFSDIRVRKAIAHALERRAIVRTVMGDIPPAKSIIGACHWAYNGDVPVYDYEPQRAAQLLDAAGWRAGSDGFRGKGGKALQFTMQPVREWERRYAALIQQYLRRVGIQMNIRPIADFATADANRREGNPQCLIQGCVDYEPGELFHSWHSSQVPPTGMNVWRYANQDVDRWLEEGNRTTDREERRRIYGRVQRKILEDCATIPLHDHLSDEVVRADRVTGYPEPAPNYNGVLFQAPWRVRLRS